MEALISRFQKLFPRQSFVHSVAVLTSGNVAGQLIVIVSSPVLTRLYTPEHFGMLSAFISILMIFFSVASWLYDRSIPLPKNGIDGVNLVGLSLLIVLFMCCVSAVVMQVSGPYVAEWVNSPQLAPYLWVLPFALLGIGSYQVLSYWGVRQRDYTCVAKATLYENFGMVMTQIMLGFTKLGAPGLLIGTAMGRLIASGTFIRHFWRRDKVQFKKISIAKMYQMASRYRRFPLISSWSSLMNEIAFHLPYLLITAFYGPAVLGWLAIAQRVLGLPLNLIGNSVSQVYMVESSRIKSDTVKLRSLFWKTIKSMTAIGIPLIAIIVLFAPLGFTLIFGEGWSQSGNYLRILSLMFVMQLVSVSIKDILYVLERQDLHLFSEVLRFVSMSGSLILAWQFGLSATMAIVCLGVGGTIGNLFPVLFAWRAINNYEQIKAHRQG